jgi:hypothetical protein
MDAPASKPRRDRVPAFGQSKAVVFTTALPKADRSSFCCIRALDAKRHMDCLPGVFALISRPNSWQRMCFQPQRTSTGGRIDAGLVPPGCLVTATMDLAVMSATERDREFIADFAADRS